MKNELFLFDFSENGCSFSWREDGGFKNTIFLSMNGDSSVDEVSIGELRMTVRTGAYWEDKNTLVLRIRPLASVSERFLKFEFGIQNHGCEK